MRARRQSSYYHDDPETLWWMFFAVAQGSYLQSGGRFVLGGSQRLSSALARAVKLAGGDVLVRRVVSRVAMDAEGRANMVTTPRATAAIRHRGRRAVVSNAAPSALAALMPSSAARDTDKKLRTAGAVDLAVCADARPFETTA